MLGVTDGDHVGEPRELDAILTPAEGGLPPSGLAKLHLVSLLAKS
ncbi:hypothetical protein [Alloactinosynnema sp. L-07]|nr:hypothetical protein [Alloactinosynnema sp. L-07]